MVWGLGSYERTAVQLLPAAEALIDVAAPTPSDRVIDLGCGTGNAALLAAKWGSRVIGVDPAPRLLEVAAARASDKGFDASFVEGEAASIPLEDEAADLLLSVFGVVFAPDAEVAAAEMSRVTAPGGRIVISAWIPDGAISQAARIGREAVAKALDAPPGPPPFPWHEQVALAELFGIHGFTVETEEHSLSFTGTSPREWVEEEARNHPLQVAGAAVLEPRGEADAVRKQVLEVFEAANEDPSAFKVTSRYVIATVSVAP
jgi:ubiquinone/menaquinone biosynthesis C-methylase UbiE